MRELDNIAGMTHYFTEHGLFQQGPNWNPGGNDGTDVDIVEVDPFAQPRSNNNNNPFVQPPSGNNYDNNYGDRYYYPWDQYRRARGLQWGI